MSTTRRLKKEQEIDRKSFLTVLVAIAAGGWAVACGDGEDAAVSTCVDGTTASISANHGHTLSVPEADVLAGVEKTYDIRGTSAHGHSVTLEEADFLLLAQGDSVVVTSTIDDGHIHEVTVRCA